MKPRADAAGEMENKVDLKQNLLLFHLVPTVSVTLPARQKKNAQTIAFTFISFFRSHSFFVSVCLFFSSSGGCCCYHR
jgi:hypothetical protein